MNHLKSILILIFLSFLLGCAEEKTPSRDHIPLIKEKLTGLQTAVHSRNRAAIDSLLSVDILQHEQDSDSLLRFVYGPDGSFAFEIFGQPVIIYTDKIAKVECYLMDSSRQTDRPITLTFAYDNELWLLSKFEVTERIRDSL